MPKKQITPLLSRNVLIFVFVSMLLTIFGGAGVMFYIGFFTDAKVQKNIAPPYKIAYLTQIGPYSDVKPTLERVAEKLKEANIEHETACVLLLDDSNVPEEKRRAKIGYLVNQSTYVPGPLEIEELPQREILMATFNGGALMGSYKAYEAMKEWAKYNDYTLSMPALEIYHPDGVKEYQLYIRRNK